MEIVLLLFALTEINQKPKRIKSVKIRVIRVIRVSIMRNTFNLFFFLQRFFYFFNVFVRNPCIF